MSSGYLAKLHKSGEVKRIKRGKYKVLKEVKLKLLTRIEKGT